MKSIFRGRRLQSKLIFIYITMAIVPIILISTISYSVYYNSIIQKADAFVEQSAQQHRDKIESQLQQYSRMLYNIVVDQNIIELGKTINGKSNLSTPPSIETCKINMKNKFLIYSQFDKYVSSIFYLSKNDEYCDYSKRLGSFNDKLWTYDLFRRDYYNQVVENDGLTYISTENISLYKNYNSGERSEYSFCIGFPLKDIFYVDKDLFGSIYIAIDESSLRPYTDEENNLSRRTGVETFIIDEKNNIVSANDSKYLATSYDKYISERFENENQLMEKFTSIENAPWRIVNVIDKSVYYKDVSTFTKIVMVFAIIITIGFLGMILLISQRYARSISNIAAGIKNYAQGDKTVNVHVDNEDELYLIANQFNKMTQKNNLLVHTLEQKNVAIRSAVTRQKKAEIKALEAQINPHFLYNTLDTINWMAINNDEYEISNMISLLGSILRYSVSNIDVLVSLRAEIEWMKKYTMLQRNRFSGSFDCEYDIAEETLDFPIYKLLLQPLVENSILHGFETVKSGGKISLKTSLNSQKSLVVEISDNGCGISSEQLRKMQHDVNNKTPLSSDSIGISNTINRLELYYHGGAQIKIDSEVGEGTKITLIIPYIEGNSF